MNGRFLLDTNIVIAFFNKEINIVEKVALSGGIFISSTILGELYFGAQKSRKKHENLITIEQFISESSVLSCDISTAREFGTIKHQLQSKGKPIPDNDIWIAAMAKQYNLTLVTRDEHFQGVENLFIENW